MRQLRSLLHIIDAVSEWTGKITSFIIVLIIGVVIWNVVMRYVFHSRALWEQIYTCGRLLTVYVILGGAYALLTRAHVNVDILHQRFSSRIRAIVDLATSALFFIFCIALLWMGVRYAGWEFERLHLSLRLLAPPSWPVRLVIPVGVSLLLLQGLAKFIRDLIMAITGREAA